MKALWLLTFGLLAVCAVFAGGEKDDAPAGQTPATYFDGDGGEGASITILPLNGRGIPDEQDYLLEMILGEFMANFSDYSNISVFDRINLENNYKELYSGYYEDYSKEQDMGHLPPTTYIMNGSITKTADGYALQIQITRLSDKMLAASYSGRWTLGELDNFIGIRRASSELLGKLGVRLTDAGRQKLESAADERTINSQTALARANVAPTAFGKMQYTYQAAAIDPNLKEASQRLSEYQTSIFEIPAFSAPEFAAPTFTLPVIRPVSTGNIGADARDEIARYRANQAAIKEQQEALLRQREEVLGQWRDFLRQLAEQRRTLQDQEDALFQRQGELAGLLREAQSFYADHPPFRIFYDPKVVQYGEIDFTNETLNLWFQIGSEPVSVEALLNVLDALSKLNESFATVNAAFGDMNTVMAAQFSRAETTMAALKDAMDAVNSAGAQYNVEPVSADWTVPPGDTADGAALKTSWNTDYPREFYITASLLNETGDVIGSGSASLANDISWNGPLDPEAAFAWCEFHGVNVDAITDTLTVRIDTVNNRDAETAVMTGYIAIDADGSRTAAIGKKTASRESWRNYWSDSRRSNSLGVAIGSAFNTPTFLASVRLTASPLPYSFFELGSDFGLVHRKWDTIKGINYFSISPYLHLNAYARTSGNTWGAYIGVGGGANFSRYTYPSESRVDPLILISPVFDFNMGMRWMRSHSVIDIRYTVKTNFKGADQRLTLGYSYRFGYFAERYGGEPASLINRR